MLKKSVFTILAIMLFSGSILAETKVTMGEVRDMATDKLLFNFKSETKFEGDNWTFTSTYTYPDGTPAVIESGEVKGNMVQSYKVDQKQTGEKAQILVKDGKILFSVTDKDGKTKTDKEDMDPRLIVGPTLSKNLMLNANWEKLLKGDKVKFRFGVWHRKETVGFRFFKNRDYEENGKKLMNVVMNPTSWLIRQLVDDLTITYDVEKKRMLRIKGRVAPKIKKGDEWKDLDAVTTYSYPDEAGSNQAAN